MNHHIAGMICAMLLASPCLAEAKPLPDAYASPAGKSLKRFLQTWDGDEAKKTRYVAAFEDINADGIPEAIVHLISNGWCRNGSCPTLILTQDKNSWTIVTTISATQPPILVLPDTSSGWNNIGVWVQSENIQPGYEVELRFNGKTYPNSPTIPPAQQLKDGSAGKMVIPRAKDAVPLY